MGSAIFKWIGMLSNSIWKSHPPVHHFGFLYHRGCRNIMWKCPVGYSTQNWYPLSKSSTGGVCICNVLAQSVMTILLSKWFIFFDILFKIKKKKENHSISVLSWNQTKLPLSDVDIFFICISLPCLISAIARASYLVAHTLKVALGATVLGTWTPQKVKNTERNNVHTFCLPLNT